MSPFKHALAARDAHVRTLRFSLLVMLLIAAGLGIGWYTAPRHLTLHIPPDLRTGSTQAWWEVPPGSVYAFTFYIFQQLHRWPGNGETDYPRNIQALQAYLTPACRTLLEQDARFRQDAGELSDRVRGVYEIPGRGFDTQRVKVLSRDSWLVTLDLTVDEYFSAESVKRALVRYPLKVVRYDVDAQKNPWGLALDCYDGNPLRLEPAPDGGES